MTVDSITCYFRVLQFSYKLVNNVFVNNFKKAAPSSGFPILHFVAKKRRQSEPKDETTTRNKTQTASKSKTNSDYIRTCQKVEKWKKDFYFWKTLDGRPTNDSSRKVTWIHDDPESENVTCWVCRKYPSERDQDNDVT